MGISATFVQSQESDLTNIRNAGAFTCSQVVPILSNPGNEIEKTAFLQWTAGFSTAASRANRLTDVFPITDTWTMLQMVVRVCKENDAVNFETALRLTISRLSDFWIRDEVDLVTLNDPSGASLTMYNAAIQPLQQRLQSLGVAIDVDGVYGNQTGRAISRINSELGLGSLLIPDGNFWYFLTRSQ